MGVILFVKSFLCVLFPVEWCMLIDRCRLEVEEEVKVVFLDFILTICSVLCTFLVFYFFFSCSTLISIKEVLQVQFIRSLGTNFDIKRIQLFLISLEFRLFMPTELLFEFHLCDFVEI